MFALFIMVSLLNICRQRYSASSSVEEILSKEWNESDEDKKVKAEILQILQQLGIRGYNKIILLDNELMRTKERLKEELDQKKISFSDQELLWSNFRKVQAHHKKQQLQKPSISHEKIAKELYEKLQSQFKRYPDVLNQFIANETLKTELIHSMDQSGVQVKCVLCSKVLTVRFRTDISGRPLSIKSLKNHITSSHTSNLLQTPAFTKAKQTVLTATKRRASELTPTANSIEPSSKRSKNLAEDEVLHVDDLERFLSDFISN